MITRRAALLAGAGSLLVPALAGAQNQDDVAALQDAYLAEKATEAVYRLADFSDFAALADHEAAQAAALATALEALGARIPPVPSDTELRESRETWQRLAARRELEAIAVLQTAITKVEDGKLLHTLASMMAAAGQHLVMLRRLMDEDELPRAVEPGATI